jgi:hypothetical protein
VGAEIEAEGLGHSVGLQSQRSKDVGESSVASCTLMVLQKWCFPPRWGGDGKIWHSQRLALPPR